LPYCCLMLTQFWGGKVEAKVIWPLEVHKRMKKLPTRRSMQMVNTRADLHCMARSDQCLFSQMMSVGSGASFTLSMLKKCFPIKVKSSSRASCSPYFNVSVGFFYSYVYYSASLRASSLASSCSKVMNALQGTVHSCKILSKFLSVYPLSASISASILRISLNLRYLMA